MAGDLLKRRIEDLASDAAQRDNAVALLAALKGTVLAEISHDNISINSFTSAICFDWLAAGEWDSVEAEVYSDRIETYLSRDQELRINHWPYDPRSPALENVVRELLDGMA